MTRLFLAALLLAGCCPAPRPASHDEGFRRPRHETRTGAPMGSPGASPSPLQGRVTQSPPPIRMQPAATAKPRAATPARHRISGTATWFRSPSGVSAAGPALRQAVGPGWRGTRVLVCSAGRCVRTVLGDWCACGHGRVIDLDDNVFAALAPLSRGVLAVTVRW